MSLIQCCLVPVDERFAATRVMLDEEDEFFSLKSNFSHSKLKTRPSSVPRAEIRKAKKARLTNSCTRSCKESSGFDEIKRFCEDFNEGFTGFKIPAGCERSNKDLWVDKYAPYSLEELAVHKKKVEEVKVWFEERLRNTREEFCNHVLLISGQAGVGKSATVRMIASHLGATIFEWNMPTPTIWQEHLHNSNSGIRYTSKLDEFENFVERIRKYGMIPSTITGGSQTSIIFLIDDLPLTLQTTTHVPGTELQLSLQSAGACKVAFNPITVNSIKKVLSKICREEQCKVTADQIDLIAKASGGDIRQAITSFQYFCLKSRPILSLSFSNGTPTYSKERSHELNRLDDGFSFPFGRDETLSLFHALGKFLHNKRETENSFALDKDAFVLKERFARLPLKMDAPEKVLCLAHGQARPIADFLHENVLDFVSEEAIDDASVVASYLSDADFLLASLSGILTRNYEAENVVQSAAASVAVRGVLFGNFHPSPSRWHAIRRPKLWQVEQSLWHNKLEMVNQSCVAYNGVSLSNLSVIATENKPVLKWLGFRVSEGLEAPQVLMQGNVVEDKNFDSMSLDKKDNDTSDDEIEDW
ncbi:hypothetical protein F0562_003956 [Nyssa sinensis]|uniref:AAA+ ATPase domain-containing protein n=1 Tax=Nyssa sinensis TaxID=561372 RepID=A0A5J5C0S1_9ASTE|nr:hypothetical protein F0562_003956 [Nyssa sinensis]